MSHHRFDHLFLRNGCGVFDCWLFTCSVTIPGAENNQINDPACNSDSIPEPRFLFPRDERDHQREDEEPAENLPDCVLFLFCCGFGFGIDRSWLIKIIIIRGVLLWRKLAWRRLLPIDRRRLLLRRRELNTAIVAVGSLIIVRGVAARAEFHFVSFSYQPEMIIVSIHNRFHAEKRIQNNSGP